MHRLLLVLALAGCKNEVGNGGMLGKKGEPPPGTTVDGGTMPPPSTPFVASEVIVRRLSQTEIDNSVDDLLGDDTRPATQYLIEDDYSPYDNDYTGQLPSQALIDAVEVMSKDVAERLVADATRRDAVVGCTPTGPGDEDCFRSFVSAFGRKVFRRELTAEDVDPYVGLLAFATEDNPYVDNDFYTAVALAIQAMLMDPEFLYRIEVGTPTAEDPTVHRLDGFEIAARLSYLLWGTTPDDELLADAAAGNLDGAAGRRTAATRMLESDKARRQLRRFHSMWLGYRAIPGDPQLLAGFARETSALIDRVVFEQKQSYVELFMSNQTYVDDALADHYGFDRPQGGEGWVDYPDGSKRAGILSHGSLLAGFSKFSDTSPTQRGILVRTRLMCETIPPPPPTVDVDQPPSGQDAVCKADRYAAHVEVASCANCHNGMDPIGFGLENFDVAGRWRDHDDGLPECTIDGIGHMPTGETFSGPQELAELLLQEDRIQRCAVKQYLSYAIGRKPKPIEDQPIDDLTGKLRETDYRFDEMILEYVASDAFALKMEGSE